MNKLPINSETDIIKSILAETALCNQQKHEQLQEDAGGAIMQVLGKLGSKLARRPLALPPGAGTDIMRATTGAMTTPGKVEWEPIPQIMQAAKNIPDLQTVTKNIPWGGLAAAAGLGGLAYLGSQASKDKKQEPSMLPVSPAKEIGGVKMSPTSPSGVTDPNKPWVPETPAVPKPLTPEPSSITKPSLSDYKMAPEKLPAVEMPSGVWSPFGKTPTAPKSQPATPVSAPRSTGTVAPGQMSPTRSDEPTIPAPSAQPAVKKSESKLPEQPMDVAAMAAQMRTDRFAAEREKATPEQKAAVEANAKRLGVTPWTQEHYDAVSKDIAAQKAQSPEKPNTKSIDSTRDVSNIVPGSQMWGELSAGERQSIRDRYAKGEGPSVSIRYNKETGKFDEPGYGDQGHYGDIVKALNMNESVLAYCNFISENLGVNLDAYGRNKKGKKRARRFLERQGSHPHASWSGDTNSVEDLSDESPKERVADPEQFMKTAAINILQDAQSKGIKMTHGQVQQRALDMLKKHMGQQ